MELEMHITEEKTLVLTLGSPLEKGGKKNLGINLGQSAGKGWGKKNPGINPGQPAGKGRKKKTSAISRHRKRC
jgi:hypothetical protein